MEISRQILNCIFFPLNLSWIYGCLSVLVSTECVYEISYD